MELIDVRVQESDFDVGAELGRLRANDAGVGAVGSFVGVVRDLNDGAEVATMHLEHYPGMTERSIETIVREAATRWALCGAIVVHRVGKLKPCDQIVLVAVSSAHRGDAFSACEFIMDFLKMRAPFWKRESTPDGDRWVTARSSDDAAAQRWNKA
jgi:molybdopterin synthase catalytic subunit